MMMVDVAEFEILVIISLGPFFGPRFKVFTHPDAPNFIRPRLCGLGGLCRRSRSHEPITRCKTTGAYIGEFGPVVARMVVQCASQRWDRTTRSPRRSTIPFHTFDYAHSIPRADVSLL